MATRKSRTSSRGRSSNSVRSRLDVKPTKGEQLRAIAYLKEHGGGPAITSPQEAMRGYAVRRPEVLRVLEDIHVHDWGWTVEFLGQGYELIDAGVAFAEMFELPPCGTKKSGRDEFGDYYMIRPRPGGRFELSGHFDVEPSDRGNQGKGRGWKARGPAVCAEVEAAIQRMRRPRESA
jgi:hypothetical protein